MNIKVKKITADAKIPTYLHKGDACFDFYSNGNYMAYPRTHTTIHTGIELEIPKGYHIKLFMRSSYGLDTPLRLANCVGIIDSPYRGEITAVFDNISDQSFTISKGERFMRYQRGHLRL